jgi:hypothetical protein
VDPGLGEDGPAMHALALRRSREAGLPVTLMPLSAETLPAPDASFDSIVCTYSLCTIPDPAAALAEIDAPATRLGPHRRRLPPRPRHPRAARRRGVRGAAAPTLPAPTPLRGVSLLGVGGEGVRVGRVKI